MRYNKKELIYQAILFDWCGWYDETKEFDNEFEAKQLVNKVNEESHPLRHYSYVTSRKMTLAEKQAAWKKELEENNEFLDWFIGNGSILSGAGAYMGTLEWQAYDNQARQLEERNRTLKNKLRYARR